MSERARESSTVSERARESSTQRSPTVPVFVGIAELEKWLHDSPEQIRLLEIRYDRKGTGGDDGSAGHLPGAVIVDLATELSRTDAAPTDGRRPLPHPADLQRSARRWGLCKDSTVVVYDTRSGLSAARAWWVLRWAGLAQVSILDGGSQAWSAAGHPLSTDEPDVAPGDVKLSSGGMPELDADAAAALAARGLLVDAREAAAYSCGGGVAGAFAVAALAHTGVTAPLYVGSFSAWSADPERAVATGAEPGTTEDSL